MLGIMAPTVQDQSKFLGSQRAAPFTTIQIFSRISVANGFVLAEDWVEFYLSPLRQGSWLWVKFGFKAFAACLHRGCHRRCWSLGRRGRVALLRACLRCKSEWLGPWSEWRDSFKWWTYLYVITCCSSARISIETTRLRVRRFTYLFTVKSFRWSFWIVERIWWFYVQLWQALARNRKGFLLGCWTQLAYSCSRMGAKIFVVDTYYSF
jgi:hypothetical protein